MIPGLEILDGGSGNILSQKGNILEFIHYALGVLGGPGAHAVLQVKTITAGKNHSEGHHYNGKEHDGYQ